MNFVAHVHVALLAKHPCDDTVDFAFGAALPDLASMAGTRLDRAVLPDAVREGVAFHHRTDAVFHSLPEFRSGVSYLAEQLKAAGLATGPSRAVAHAGWELLLDGCLLDQAGVDREFSAVLDGAPDVVAAASPDDPERWRRLLAAMRSDRWWRGYRDGDLVARALQRRLASRSRLAFSVAELPLVSETLVATKPDVERALGRIMSAVIVGVAEAS